MVAAEADMKAPDFAAAEGEACSSGGQHCCRVSAGAAPPRFTQVGAHGHGTALRNPFLAPPSGQIQHFNRCQRHRQRQDQAVHFIGVSSRSR